MAWTCVRVHPNCDKIAIRNLVNQDFNYYQPKILERKLRKQRQLLVEQPLFPNYLFVEIINKWLTLQSTYGIAAVLSAGSLPSIVNDSIINDLKSREVNGFIQLPKPKKFNIGDQVQINAGVFTGQKALVERMNPSERQKVLLALLGNKIKVLIDEDEIEFV